MDSLRSITPNRPASAPPIAIAAGLLLLLVAAYVAAYCFNRDPFGCSETVGDGSVVVFYFPQYRMGGHWASTVFWPLEKLDRKCRPAAWRKKVAAPTKSLGTVP